jgi:hypothetical protein
VLGVAAIVGTTGIAVLAGPGMIASILVQNNVILLIVAFVVGQASVLVRVVARA